jgi:hypothetical protein
VYIPDINNYPSIIYSMYYGLGSGDSGALEVSINNGAWTAIRNYTSDSNSGSAWVREPLRITCCPPYDVQVRFKLHIGGSPGLIGIIVDDFKISYGVNIKRVYSTGSEMTDEMVVLYNYGLKPVDISGWTIWNSGGQIDDPAPSLPAPTIMYGGTNMTFSGTSADDFADSGDAVILKDKNDAPVDFIRFGASTANPPSNLQWTGNNPEIPELGGFIYRINDPTDINFDEQYVPVDTDDSSDLELHKDMRPGGCSHFNGNVLIMPILVMPTRSGEDEGVYPPDDLQPDDQSYYDEVMGELEEATYYWVDEAEQHGSFLFEFFAQKCLKFTQNNIDRYMKYVLGEQDEDQDMPQKWKDKELLKNLIKEAVKRITKFLEKYYKGSEDNNNGVEAMETIVELITTYLEFAYKFTGLDPVFNQACVILVFDSRGTEHGTFEDGNIARSYLGGPLTIMASDCGYYGTDNLDLVAAHELGHIFYGLDEYWHSNDPRVPGNPFGAGNPWRSGYLNAENLNHEYNNITNPPWDDTEPYEDKAYEYTGEPCIMKRFQIDPRSTPPPGTTENDPVQYSQHIPTNPQYEDNDVLYYQSPLPSTNLELGLTSTGWTPHPLNLPEPRNEYQITNYFEGITPDTHYTKQRYDGILDINEYMAGWYTNVKVVSGDYNDVWGQGLVRGKTYTFGTYIKTSTIIYKYLYPPPSHNFNLWFGWGEPDQIPGGNSDPFDYHFGGTSLISWNGFSHEGKMEQLYDDWTFMCMTFTLPLTYPSWLDHVYLYTTLFEGIGSVCTDSYVVITPTLNELPLCAHTRKMIGWWDGDNNGIMDVLETHPQSNFNDPNPLYTTNPTPAITGSAMDIAVVSQNPFWPGRDMTINTISEVQYTVGNDIWYSSSDDPSSSNYNYRPIAWTYLFTLDRATYYSDLPQDYTTHNIHNDYPDLQTAFNNNHRVITNIAKITRIDTINWEINAECDYIYYVEDTGTDLKTYLGSFVESKEDFKFTTTSLSIGSNIITLRAITCIKNVPDLFRLINYEYYTDLPEDYDTSVDVNNHLKTAFTNNGESLTNYGSTPPSISRIDSTRWKVISGTPVNDGTKEYIITAGSLWLYVRGNPLYIFNLARDSYTLPSEDGHEISVDDVEGLRDDFTAYLSSDATIKKIGTSIWEITSGIQDEGGKMKYILKDTGVTKLNIYLDPKRYIIESMPYPTLEVVLQS